MAVTPSKITGDLAQTQIAIPAAGGVLGSPTKLVSLGDFELTEKNKMVDATDTDSGGAESTLPSTYSWSGTAKYMYVDGDPEQQAAIMDAVAAQNTPGLVAPTWTFFPTKASGRDTYTGQAWIESKKTSSGVGKLAALDITLRGVGFLKRSAQA